MDSIKTFSEFLNEGAKITPSKLTHEGEEAAKFLNSIFRTGTVKVMNFKDNVIEITFEDNLDLTDDIFGMVQKWTNAPSHLDLHIDVMSVNRGKLNMVVFGKPGIHFDM
jgi:hypothetical protein